MTSTDVAGAGGPSPGTARAFVSLTTAARDSVSRAAHPAVEVSPTPSANPPQVHACFTPWDDDQRPAQV